jgi:Putative peptidoglycan binding domain/Peptidase family M23
MGMPNPFEGFPITDDWAAHRARGSLGGTDFGTPVGTPIVAPNAGFVSYEYGNGSGGYIISLALADSPGYVMQFLHCSAFEGTNRDVKPGDLLGYTGGAAGAPGAGSSTGPHVHLHIINPNGGREDVMPWFVSAPPAVASVREYQTLLNNYGYGLDVDGINGPKTKAAVKDFQTNHGLTVDGIVGPATTAELRKPIPVAAPKPVPATTAPETSKPEKPVDPKPSTTKPVQNTKPTPSKPATSKPTQLAKEPAMATIKSLPDAANTAATDSLGILIPDPKGRKLAYALYGLASLIVSNVAVAVLASGMQAPVWLVIALAVVGNLAAPFSTLAIANAGSKK